MPALCAHAFVRDQAALQRAHDVYESHGQRVLLAHTRQAIGIQHTQLAPSSRLDLSPARAFGHLLLAAPMRGRCPSLLPTS